MSYYIPISTLKPISDKNYASGRNYSTIDFDAMLSTFPDMTHLNCLGVTKRNNKTEVMFSNPGRGFFLRMSVTKSQLKEIHNSMGI
jgi:hypothetical protein